MHAPFNIFCPPDLKHTVKIGSESPTLKILSEVYIDLLHPSKSNGDNMKEEGAFQDVHNSENESPPKQGSAMKGKTPKSKARGRGRGRGRTTGAADPSSSSHPVAMGTSDLTALLEGVTLLRPSTRFQKLLESSCLPEPEEQQQSQERDFILSQDFFCTPDYITPDAPQITSCLEFDKENVCPKSPEKSTVARSKRYKRDLSPSAPQSTNLASQYEPMEITREASSKDGLDNTRSSMDDSQKKKRSYVSQTAVALRCRVMPPPCIKNPYLNVASSHVDAFCDRRSKLSGFSPSVGGDGLSRYRTDFHELEQIGYGNFSRVFKVLKRIDGCLYAVKQSIKQLHSETERKRALMEVQALAALGSHENIIAYYTSWFENEQLFIQMELCDHSLTITKYQAPKCSEVLEMLYQIAKALNFMHERGTAHLDIKPENIYAKSGTYKLGDFGCATLMDHSLGIEEGDARYMPNEMLKDQCEYLDKVDIFSLGAAIYEILKGTPLPDSGPKFYSLREGKISLLPGYPVQFQNLLKTMMDPDPVKRPSAREILENPIFDKLCPVSKSQSKSKQ